MSIGTEVHDLHTSFFSLVDDVNSRVKMIMTMADSRSVYLDTGMGVNESFESIFEIKFMNL